MVVAKAKAVGRPEKMRGWMEQAAFTVVQQLLILMADVQQLLILIADVQQLVTQVARFVQQLLKQQQPESRAAAAVLCSHHQQCWAAMGAAILMLKYLLREAENG